MALQNPYGYSPYYGGNKDYMLNASAHGGRRSRRRSRSPYAEVQSHYRPLFSARRSVGTANPRGNESGYATANTALDSGSSPAISIHVFRNGDAVEQAVEVRVSIKLFRTWLVFLDHLTTKTDSPKPVHWLYDMHGREVDDFRLLRDGENYVAAHTKPFKRVDYDLSGRKDWDKKHMHIDYRDPTNLNSDESLRLYQTIRTYEHKHVPHRPLEEHFSSLQSKSPSTGSNGRRRRRKRSKSADSGRGGRRNRSYSEDEGGYYSSPSPGRRRGSNRHKDSGHYRRASTVDTRTRKNRRTPSSKRDGSRKGWIF